MDSEERHSLKDPPTDNDVISGRGRGVWTHQGNIILKSVIKSHCEKYDKAANKSEKIKITNEVYEIMVSRGARYIRQEDEEGRWVELTKEEAREKTAKALRGFFKRWKEGQSCSPSLSPVKERLDTIPQELFHRQSPSIRRHHSLSEPLASNIGENSDERVSRRSLCCTGSGTYSPDQSGAVDGRHEGAFVDTKFPPPDNSLAGSSLLNGIDRIEYDSTIHVGMNLEPRTIEEMVQAESIMFGLNESNEARRSSDYSSSSSDDDDINKSWFI